ncbi:MAG: hypothetical protein MUF87_12035 [Anaerolineae bacterium]|jgi:hypothetical protein|nr:hypothetical protein [Anaerolineae bacterium]
MSTESQIPEAQHDTNKIPIIGIVIPVIVIFIVGIFVPIQWINGRSHDENQTQTALALIASPTINPAPTNTLSIDLIVQTQDAIDQTATAA